MANRGWTFGIATNAFNLRENRQCQDKQKDKTWVAAIKEKKRSLTKLVEAEHSLHRLWANSSGSNTVIIQWLGAKATTSTKYKSIKAASLCLTSALNPKDKYYVFVKLL